MSGSRILVVGSANMDIVVAAERLPRPGETLLGGELRMFAGGKGANQAVAAARAGGDVGFLGRVGRDSYGAELRAGLIADGIDTRALAEVDGASGVALIVTGESDNMIVVAPGANAALTAETIDDDAFAGTGYVLLQLETPLDGVARAVALADAAGAVVILDPAPAQALPGDLLARVDWLTPNQSEARTLLGDATDAGNPADIAERLLALGPRGVVLKLGGGGALLATPGAPPIHVSAFAVTVADTTAAGDAFNGAFAVALGEGMSPPDAVRFACAAAAISVSRRGAQPSMATRAEIDAMLGTPS